MPHLLNLGPTGAGRRAGEQPSPPPWSSSAPGLIPMLNLTVHPLALRAFFRIAVSDGSGALTHVSLPSSFRSFRGSPRP